MRFFWVILFAPVIALAQTYNVAITNSLLGPVNITATIDGAGIADTGAVKLVGSTMTGAITNESGFFGNGSGVTNISAANIAAGTVASAFDGSAVTNLSAVALNAATSFVPKVGGAMSGGLTNTSAGGFVGNGVGLTNLTLTTYPIETLSNVDSVAAPTADDVLTWNGTAWSNAAAGGYVWPEQQYDPRVQPASANDWDDEFGGTNLTLNASPATSGWYYAATSATNFYTVSNNVLNTFAYSASGVKNNSLWKNLPTGTFEFVCCVQNNYYLDKYIANPNLAVAASTNGAAYQLQLQESAANNLTWNVVYLNNPTSYNSDASAVGTQHAENGADTVWFKIRSGSSATNLYFGLSVNGFQFKERNLNLPFTPTLIGIGWEWTSNEIVDLLSGPHQAKILYFRRTQ